jgi:broad specificity phosphatase PhoE
VIRLYLVRHGITAWNAEGVYQGQADVPLSDEGREEMRRLGDRLRHVEFGYCYTSTLQRARESAAILLAGRTCTVFASADLNEMSYGKWEGLTRQDIRACYPADWDAFMADRENQAPPAGESAADLYRRVRRFAASLAYHQTEGETSILVAAHGGSLRTLIAFYLGLANRDARRLRLENASLSIVEVYAGDAIVSLLNDTSHLSPLKSPPDSQPVH